MTDIAPGTYVRVPKGTIVYDGFYNTKKKVTTRDQKVKIKRIFDAVEQNDVLLTDADHDAYQKERPVWQLFYNVGFGRNNQPHDPQARELERKRYESDLKAWEAKFVSVARATHGADLRAVEWSGNKWALVKDVEAIEAPEHTTKAKPVTKKQQMVKDSVWIATQDAEIGQLVRNSAYDKAIKDFWNKNRSKYPNGGNHAIEHVQNVLKIPEDIEHKLFDLKKGDEVTVTGKMTKDWWPGSNGMMVPVSVNGKSYRVPYTRLEPNVDAKDIPQVKVLVLRDRTTGQFFKQIDGRYWGKATAEMTNKYSEAKKYEDMNRCKLHIMGWSGYYDGLPGAADMPDWAGGPKLIDLPETWEVVVFDKLSKDEIEVIDIQPWYKRLWQLRDLTIRFGSPVRKLYNEIEKKGELDQYECMIVACTPVQVVSSSWAHQPEMSDEEAQAFDDMIKGFELKRGEYRRTKDARGFAVAVKDGAKGFMAKMFYDGSLNLHVINLTSMQEVVQNEEKAG